METQPVSLNVNVLQTNNNEQETVKLDALPSTTISELKTKLQDLLSVPACVQKLIYSSQPLINPATTLSELYLRDGETLHMECPEKIDVEEIKQCIIMLKKFNTALSPFCTSDGQYVRMPSIDDVDKFEDLFADILEPLETLVQTFGPWKTKKVMVERQCFVQENGMEHLMDIHVFSQRKFDWFPPNLEESTPVLSLTGDDDDGNVDLHLEGEQLMESIRMDELVRSFNEWQLILNSQILSVVWSFMETGAETKLLLQYGVLQRIINAYILKQTDEVSSILLNGLYENALGCLCGFVEYDANAQQQVASNKEVINKLVHAVNAGLNSGYFEINQEYCIAANTLFYVSFDQQAIKTAIESAVHLKVMDKIYPSVRSWLTKTKQLVICYYCLLFLARLRSSTLVTIPHDQATAIDSYIDYFFKMKYTPYQISSYENEHVYVWMTLAPILHLAYAGGFTTTTTTTTTTKPRVASAGQLDGRKNAKRVKSTPDELEGNEGLSSSSDSEESFFDSDEDTTSWDTQKNIQTCKGLDFSRFPGSKAVQSLGIFALQHTLTSQDNVLLLRSENLEPYLICLLWQLQGSNRDKLATLLTELTKSTTRVIPRLSVMCKAVLAEIHGLDAVRHS